jgi:hypothetical protein
MGLMGHRPSHQPYLSPWSYWSHRRSYGWGVIVEMTWVSLFVTEMNAQNDPK